MAIKTVDQIILRDGPREKGKRTVMSETGLPAETEIKFAGTQTHKAGARYRSEHYLIVGTNDLLSIQHNAGIYPNSYWDSVVIVPNYFDQQRRYAREIGDLSRKYDLPFEVCLALGNKERIYLWFIVTMADLGDVRLKDIRDLQSGISFRTDGLRSILGNDLYNAIGIEDMGQINSERLARFVEEKCKQWISK